MARIQGIRIGATLVALVVALTTVNTLSAAAGVGVQLGAGGLTQDDVKTLNSNMKGPDVKGIGQQDPGFLGVAVGATETVQQLWVLASRVHIILGNWGVPMVIGVSAQIMVDFTMIMGIIQILGRFKF